MMRSTSPHRTLPFTAIVGQHEMKRALILNAINPMIGGVLIRGEKGTAKSTAVRALATILPLSRSPELALRRLREIPTGGRTPLAAGLQKGFEVLNREMRKKHDIIPMMMLISDGRANAGEGPIRQELGILSDTIAECGIRTIVIDTEAAENGQSLSLGYCRMIAERTHGSYHAISDLSPGVIESIAREEKGFWTGS